MRVDTGTSTANQDEERRQAIEALVAAAPIIGSADEVRSFLLSLHNADHAGLAKAQAWALAPVFEAFEAAQLQIPEVQPTGREDVPFSAQTLEHVYLQVGELMGVVQTQLPVLVSDALSAEELKTMLLQGRATAYDSLYYGGIAGGGHRICLSYENPSNENDFQESRGAVFGFLSLRVHHPPTKDGMPHERTFAIPLMTIDAEMLRAARRTADGETMLRSFQCLMGVINHDYFHLLTPHNINPYFFSQNKLFAPNPTPYDVLMGGAGFYKPDHPDEEARRQAFLAAAAAAGGEIARGDREFVNQFKVKARHGSAEAAIDRYDTDRFWRAFNPDKTGSGAYEFHALFVHCALYTKYLHDGSVGRAMEKHIDGFFQGLFHSSEDILARKGAREAQEYRIFYATMLYLNLLRIVPHSHPLLQRVEKHIDGLSFDDAFLKRQLYLRLTKGNGDKDGLGISRNSDVLYMLPDSREDSEVIKASEFIRWQSYALVHDDLSRLHMPEARKERDNALPLFRKVMSVITRDFRLAEWRGGLPAFAAAALAAERMKEVKRREEMAGLVAWARKGLSRNASPSPAMAAVYEAMVGGQDVAAQSSLPPVPKI